MFVRKIGAYNVDEIDYRYATVGRNASHGHHQNYNNTYYGIPQYYPPQQQQQTIQAQVLQQDEPAGQKRRPHRQHSGSNDSLAARINSNLTSDQVAACVQIDISF